MTLFNMKSNNILKIVLCVTIGIIIGGYLFSDTQPRSLLAVHKCEQTCLKPQELLGLANSVLLNKFPNFVPLVVFETDKSIAIKHPAPQSPVHFVVFPKRDIKNIGLLSKDDKEYLIDTFSVLSQLISDQSLSKYQVITNGPGYQHTTYLHFHLQAER